MLNIDLFSVRSQSVGPVTDSNIEKRSSPKRQSRSATVKERAAKPASQSVSATRKARPCKQMAC